MTTPPIADVAVVTTAGSKADTSSYIDWPAIIAGIILASAISLVLLTFGSAIGLSFTDFNAPDTVSPIWIAIAAASWLLWVLISSFMAGAYLTGRMRRRHHDASEEESDIRDGAHGLLVWAGSLVIGGILAAGGIGSLLNAAGSAAATATTAASNVAGGAAEGAADAMDPNAYFVDALFRSPAPGGAAAPAADAPAGDAPAATDTPAAPATDTAAPPATTTSAAPAAPATTAAAPATPAGDPEAVRGEAGRIFAQGAVTGEVSADDRAYLGQMVAQNTGMTQEEATARVDQVMTQMDQAREEAAAAADDARRVGIIAAFLTAAALLAAAAAAFWAAQKGGNHRDNNTYFGNTFRRF
jgi:hypothetical protein